MEIKRYFYLAKKWLWLIVVGAILGCIGAYIINSRQPVIYQTTAKVMIMRPAEANDVYYYFSEIYLTKSYSQLIVNDEVLKNLSERLGYDATTSKIEVRQVTDSTMLEIVVKDSDPVKVAQVANSLSDVFIEYNENLQADRYTASEQSLQAKISEVEKLINNLQGEITTETEQEIAERNQKRLEELKQELDATDKEIIRLESELAALYPVPLPTSTPASSYRPTATPVPTPTLSPEAMLKQKELQNQLDQLRSLRGQYRDAYNQLLVQGRTSQDTAGEQKIYDQQQAMLALYQQIYANLLSSYEAIRLARLSSTPIVVSVAKATVPTKPIQPQPQRDVPLGAVVGMFITGAIAFAIEYLDDTLKTPEDIDRYLQLPVIGLIGEMAYPKSDTNGRNLGVFVAENPLSPVTEAFRSLRTNLDFAGVDQPLKSLLITSVSPAEGKTTLAVNLAAVMAQGSRKVLLLDADLRRSNVHRFLSIPKEQGLLDLFRDHLRIPDATVTWGDPEFSVIPSGGMPPNPTELLGSAKMRELLSELEKQYDIVLLDSPPAVVADPIVLAAQVNGVLLLVEPGKTRIGPAQVLLEQLQRAGARVVGVVLNPISPRRGQYYSKYNYYSYYYTSRGYRHYIGDSDASKSRKVKKAETTEGRLENPVE